MCSRINAVGKPELIYAWQKGLNLFEYSGFNSVTNYSRGYLKYAKAYICGKNSTKKNTP